MATVIVFYDTNVTCWRTWHVTCQTVLPAIIECSMPVKPLMSFMNTFKQTKRTLWTAGYIATPRKALPSQKITPHSCWAVHHLGNSTITWQRACSWLEITRHRVNGNCHMTTIGYEIQIALKCHFFGTWFDVADARPTGIFCATDKTNTSQE